MALCFAPCHGAASLQELYNGLSGGLRRVGGAVRKLESQP